MSNKDKEKKLEKKDPAKKEEVKETKDTKKKEPVRKVYPEPTSKKFVIATFVLVLGVIVIALIVNYTPAADPPAVIASQGSELIFVSPTSCGSMCDELAPIAKEYAEKVNIGFRKVNYEQDLTSIPGIYFLGKTDMTTITAITEKKHVVTYFCQHTGNEDICSELDVKLDSVKTNKPVVELFVMSHCPYGLQMEKGMLPVVELLGDKINFDLKFVYYAMHGETEVNEQMLQYCIQEHQQDRLIPYLVCFVDSGNGPDCFKSAEMNQTLVRDCYDGLNEEFGVLDDLADKGTYISGRFPKFVLHEEDNVKYNIKGSPALIINGKKSDAGRDSASLLKAVCESFEVEPEECSTELESRPPKAGFGTGEFGATDDASCS